MTGGDAEGIFQADGGQFALQTQCVDMFRLKVGIRFFAVKSIRRIRFDSDNHVKLGGESAKWAAKLGHGKVGPPTLRGRGGLPEIRSTHTNRRLDMSRTRASYDPIGACFSFGSATWWGALQGKTTLGRLMSIVEGYSQCLECLALIFAIDTA